MGENLLTAKEVAEKLGISSQLVYRMYNEGKLRGHTLAKKAIRFSQEDVDDYLRLTRNPPSASER